MKIKNVLIVDDEKGIAAFIKKLLNKIPGKYNVNTAGCGLDAIKLLNDPAGVIPDVVILDLKLSDIDGLEVCKKIRQSEKTKHTNVLIMSGYITPENKEQLISCGANDYISKPFEIKTFIEKFNKLATEVTEFTEKEKE